MSIFIWHDHRFLNGYNHPVKEEMMKWLDEKGFKGKSEWMTPHYNHHETNIPKHNQWSGPTTKVTMTAFEWTKWAPKQIRWGVASSNWGATVNCQSEWRKWAKHKKHKFSSTSSHIARKSYERGEEEVNTIFKKQCQPKLQ